MDDTLQSTIELALILLLVIFAVAVVVERIKLPYTIALLLAGLFGIQRGFHDIHLTPDLILLVFLPVLLFEGAYHVRARRLWENALPIGLLAIPGVLITAAVTGAIIHLALGFSWGIALLFGALIAPTDPIAVIALFRSIGAPRQLTLIVEGESLFNDGTSIVLFQVILAVIVTGAVDPWSGGLRFVITLAGGFGVGALVGVVGSRLMRAVDNPQAQVIATVVAAYGAYLLADVLSFSGAIAVVVAGLTFGNYGMTSGVSPRTVFALGVTWDFLGFVANSLIFLLIGIELDPPTLVSNWWLIIVAFVATLVGRLVAVYGLLPWLRGRQRIPWKYHPALFWGGLRGAVSLALALSLPLTIASGEPFPQRNVLQTVAFGVVGASLLLQGLSMGRVVRALKLADSAPSEVNLDLARSRLHAVEGALLVLARERDQGEIGGIEYERLSNAYEREYAELQRQIASAHDDETTDIAQD
ncbi:MAG TPA: Na+/H+ antiporter [Ktedonobacterales bacterium]|jgi:Na+:H+ antiporter|nr:Na+/H+ antiporter [Ktedonobacterales bacterium]